MGVRRLNYSGISGYAARSLQAWSPVTTGGVITDAGGYRIHTFGTIGTSTFQVLSGLSSVEYLIVAGGGGSGYHIGAGAGAGGMLYGSIQVSNQSYTTVVGDGGVGNTTVGTGGFSAVEQNGNNSSAFGFLAFGGGAGPTGGQVSRVGGSGSGGTYWRSGCRSSGNCWSR
jgi:hypothetical protein